MRRAGSLAGWRHSAKASFSRRPESEPARRMGGLNLPFTKQARCCSDALNAFLDPERRDSNGPAEFLRILPD